MRPSIRSAAPLRTSFAAASTAAPNTTIRCHSVASPVSPSLRRHLSVVAKLNVAVFSPLFYRADLGVAPCVAQQRHPVHVQHRLFLRFGWLVGRYGPAGGNRRGRIITGRIEGGLGGFS